MSDCYDISNDPFRTMDDPFHNLKIFLNNMSDSSGSDAPSLAPGPESHFLASVTMEADVNSQERVTLVKNDVQGGGTNNMDREVGVVSDMGGDVSLSVTEQQWRAIHLASEFIPGPPPSNDEAARSLAERLLPKNAAIVPREVLAPMPPIRIWYRRWLVQLPDASTIHVDTPRYPSKAGGWNLKQRCADGSYYHFRIPDVPGDARPIPSPAPSLVTATTVSPTPTPGPVTLEHPIAQDAPIDIDTSDFVEAATSQSEGALPPPSPIPSLADPAHVSRIPEQTGAKDAPIDVDALDSVTASQAVDVPEQAPCRNKRKRNNISEDLPPKQSSKKARVVAPSEDLKADNTTSTGAALMGGDHAGDAGGEASSLPRASFFAGLTKPPPKPMPSMSQRCTVEEIIANAITESSIHACWENPKLREALDQSQGAALKTMAADGRCRAPDGVRYICVFPVKGQMCGTTCSDASNRDKHVNQIHLHELVSFPDANDANQLHKQKLPLPGVTGGAICPHCGGYIHRGESSYVKRHTAPCELWQAAERAYEAAKAEAQRLAASVEGGHT